MSIKPQCIKFLLPIAMCRLIGVLLQSIFKLPHLEISKSTLRADASAVIGISYRAAYKAARCDSGGNALKTKKQKQLLSLLFLLFVESTDRISNYLIDDILIISDLAMVLNPNKLKSNSGLNRC